MTWKELLDEAVGKLKRAGITEYELDAWYLLSEAFDLGRADYFLCRNEEIKGCRKRLEDSMADAGNKWERQESDQTEVSDRFRIFSEWINQRCARIPLQQIVGHQEFMGLDFLVNEHVLIPRQDTEVLVEWILNRLSWLYEHRYGRTSQGSEAPRLRVLDMCAGSGCIGISLERLADVPVEVLAVDVSPEAIQVAAKNADILGCVHYRIQESDLFASVEGSFDLIVSNPPYIPSAVIDTLEEEVRLHEPRLALDGDADGLTFYRKISEEAGKRLNPGGWIAYEIGYDQGEAVCGLLAARGFTDIHVIKDLAGLDRVVTAVWR